jgi:hypothetical protein
MPSLNIKGVLKNVRDEKTEENVTENTFLYEELKYTPRQSPNHNHRPLFYADLDSRFDDNASEMEFIKLTYGENGFIALECEIEDGWIVFENQKILSLEEIKPYECSTPNYYSMYIQHSIGNEKEDVYYRKENVVVDGIILGSGWYSIKL